MSPERETPNEGEEHAGLAALEDLERSIEADKGLQALGKAIEFQARFKSAVDLLRKCPPEEETFRDIVIRELQQAFQSYRDLEERKNKPGQLDFEQQQEALTKIVMVYISEIENRLGEKK